MKIRNPQTNLLENIYEFVAKNSDEHDQDRVNFRHAVVIGGSIAGLTAARVLADYFEQVTIVERDVISGKVEYRRGLPQAHHAHSLQVRGQKLLEKLLPGLIDELLENGAVALNPAEDIAFFEDRKWRKPRSKPGEVAIYSSRPLLDTILYRRLSAMEGLNFLQGRDVMGLIGDETRNRVIGVRLRSRHNRSKGEEFLTADLVVDASGRGSRAPQWLNDFALDAPTETVVEAFTGYASMIFRRPKDSKRTWKSLYMRPMAPEDTRGGLIIPLEDDRWHVTLIGMGGDYPPTNEYDFLKFARSLPESDLYEAIKDAESVSKMRSFRRTTTRQRHYENLPAYLEGFIVLGDAVFTLNPVYALGMTAAVLGSEALADSLSAQLSHNNRDFTGLAQDFQARLSKALARPWKDAASQDQAWLTTITREDVPTGRIGYPEVAQASLP